MSPPKNTNKYERKKTSDYQIVLGDFVMKEKGVIPASLVLKSVGGTTTDETLRTGAKTPSGGRSHIPFHVKLSRIISILLTSLILGNPFLSAYADELPPTYAQVLENPTVETATSTPDILDTASSTPSFVEQIVTAVESVFVPSSVSDVATTTQEVLATPVSLTEPTPEIVATTTIETATTTENIAPEKTEPVVEATTTTEDSTLAADPSLPPPEIKTPDALTPKVFFKDNECIPMDDGGYYCVSHKAGAAPTPDEASLKIIAPHVFAFANAGDDKEIYYEDTNGKVQITSNEYDDDAPSFDEATNFVVWHALINGRYQIMFYDRNNAGVPAHSLTNTEYNNTNPYIKGKSVVWQGWVNNNWQIFYIKDVTAPVSEIRQMTSDVKNNMFPHLSEKYITWQSFMNDTWHVYVYDFSTDSISQITKTSDGKYENPRFALLFEKRDENGDVKTIGYDVASGAEIPIAHGDELPKPTAPIPQADNDKALPLQTGTSTIKTIGKDTDRGEGGE